MVEEASVTQVHLRRLHEPFPHVAMVGWQAPDEERLLEHVEVALDGVVRDAEGLAERRRVQQPPLYVLRYPSHQSRKSPRSAAGNPPRSQSAGQARLGVPERASAVVSGSRSSTPTRPASDSDTPRISEGWAEPSSRKRPGFWAWRSMAPRSAANSSGTA